MELEHNDRTMCNTWQKLREIYLLAIDNGIHTHRSDLIWYNDGDWMRYHKSYPGICAEFVIHPTGRGNNRIELCGCETDGISNKEFIARIVGKKPSTHHGNILKFHFP